MSEELAKYGVTWEFTMIVGSLTLVVMIGHIMASQFSEWLEMTEENYQIRDPLIQMEAEMEKMIKETIDDR